MANKKISSHARTLEGWNWGKFLRDFKKPIIAGITMMLGYAAGLNPGFAFLGGVSAERIWGAVEYYFKESSK